MKLSPLMSQKLKELKEHGGIVEYAYYPIMMKGQEQKLGLWSYPGVEIVQRGLYKEDRPAWEIDGNTVKALFRRNLLEPIEYREGKYGEYPVKYRVIESGEG